MIQDFHVDVRIAAWPQDLRPGIQDCAPVIQDCLPVIQDCTPGQYSIRVEKEVRDEGERRASANLDGATAPSIALHLL